MSKIILSAHIERQLKKLVKKNPQLVKQAYQQVALLAVNPQAPKLHNHKLKNRDNHWSIIVTPDIRIIYTVLGGGLLLIEIGGHDEVY